MLCVLSSLGGLLQGDAIAVEARVGAGATLQLSTQARRRSIEASGSRGPDAGVAGGLLVVAPDAVTPFQGVVLSKADHAEIGGEQLVRRRGLAR